MIDLTRLLYDDGASRKPLQVVPEQKLFWNKKWWRWTRIDQNEAPPTRGAGQDMRGLFVYCTPPYTSSEHHIDKFIDNPQQYMENTGWALRDDPGFFEPLVQSRYGTPAILTFIHFEEILP